MPTPSSARTDSSLLFGDDVASLGPVPSAKTRKRTPRLPAVQAEVLTELDEDAILDAVPAEELARLYMQNEAEARQHYNRSLDLFDDKVSIVNIEEELFLKKVAERVRYLRPLKLLQLKLQNVLLFVARPDITTQDTFSVTLEYLMWAVEHNHNDYAYLKESLQDMQKILMEVCIGKKWFSTQVLQDVYVDGTTLYYKIPPLLRKLASAPERYYHISLRMNARFRSKYSLALYELLRQNLYRKQTGEMSLEEFRDHMGIPKDEYPEFKRLSARVIVPALTELDAVSDYRAEVKYRTVGRKVIAINFHIEENRKNFIPLNDEGNLDAERFSILREDFGVSGPQIREFTRTYGFKRVEEITDVLYYRYILQKRKVRKGPSLVASALLDETDKYFLTNAERTELTAAKESRRSQRQQSDVSRLVDEQRKSSKSRLGQWWQSLSQEQQQQVWSAFVRDFDNASVVRLCKLTPDIPDLSNQMVSVRLQAFVVKHGISLD